jgi:pimeloyl-ACP methyl ester carboxylesterase
MATKTIDNTQPLAVCLHASGSSHRQWLPLSAELEPHMRTIAPSLVGYGLVPFRRDRRLRLDHEVDNVLHQVELQTGKKNGPLHLVGHSYGGAVALQTAVRCPERVASLTLYEPAQFLLLFQHDGLRSPEAQEIRDVAMRVTALAASRVGRWKAAELFIDYWSFPGAWRRIPLRRKRRIVRLVPKVAAEFDALVSAQVQREQLAQLDMPVRLIYGSRTRSTARRVTELMLDTIATADGVEVAEMAHMAPCTHADRINPLIVEHVLASRSRPVRRAA